MADPRWEYLTVKIDVSGWFKPQVDPVRIDEELDARGREGWELVSAFDINYLQGRTLEVVLIFKRPGR